MLALLYFRAAPDGDMFVYLTAHKKKRFSISKLNEFLNNIKWFSKNNWIIKRLLNHTYKKNFRNTFNFKLKILLCRLERFWDWSETILISTQFPTPKISWNNSVAILTMCLNLQVVYQSYVFTFAFAWVMYLFVRDLNQFHKSRYIQLNLLRSFSNKFII